MSTGFLNNSSNILISGGVFTHLTNNHDGKSGFEQLGRLAVSAAMHTAGGSYDRPRCHENTRVAILQRLMNWLVENVENDRMLMWLYGDAGAGKSAIAQTIAERCSERSALLGSFFFSRNDARRSTETSLVATLAYQAATAVSGLKDIIISVVDKDPMIFEKNLKAQISSLLIDPINTYANHPDFDRESFPRVLIIDGLDECSDRGIQRHILETMSAEVLRCNVSLKLLIASRPEIEITATFNSRFLQSHSTRLSLSDSLQASGDIRNYLNSTFEEIKATHPQRRHIPDTWPSYDAVEKLVTSSSGQFIYASTVARYVSSLRHLPVGRLKVVLGLQASPSAKDLPFAELDILYRCLFSAIDPGNLPMVLTILGLLIFKFRSRNPSFNKVDSLNSVLSLEPGQLEFYLGELTSILEWKVTGNGNTHGDEIRITHASLTDFLLDRQRSKEFHLDEGIFFATLTRIYSEHLSQCDTTPNHLAISYAFSGFTHALHNALLTAELRRALSLLSLMPIYKCKELDEFVIFGLDVAFHLERYNDEDLLSGYMRQFDECMLAFLTDYNPGDELYLLTTLPGHGSPYSPRWARLDEAIHFIFLADTEYRNAKNNDSRVENIVKICVLEPRHAQGLFEFFTNPRRSGEFMASNDMYASAALKCLRYFARCQSYFWSYCTCALAYTPHLLSRASRTPDLVNFIRSIDWNSKVDIFSGALRSDELHFIKPACEEYLKRADPQGEQDQGESTL